MKKSIIVILMAVTIVLLLVSNIVQYLSLNKTGSIIGTSSTGDGTVGDEEYLVFEKAGKYILYRQFSILESGEYTEIGDSI